MRTKAWVAILIIVISSVSYVQFYNTSTSYLVKKKWERKLKKKARFEKIREHRRLIRGEIDYDNNGKVIESTHQKYPQFNSIKEYQKALQNAAANKTISNTTWTERGPGNYGGRVTSLVYDPNNKDIFYAGTAGGGVFKSTNRGDSWQVMTDDLPSLVITQVAMSAANSNVIYAGTGDPFASSRGSSGIFKSYDAGNTWSMLTNTQNSNFSQITKIVVNPANENNLVVATTKGVFYSTNGGTSFSSTNVSSRTTDLEYSSTNFNIQLASVQGQGVYRSTNGGQSWSSVLNSGGGRGSLAISESNPSIAYFMYSNSSSMSKFYKTTNGGQSWSSLPQNGSEKNVFAYPQWPNVNQGWYDQSLIVDPYNPNIFFAGGIYFYKGTVNGSNVSLSQLNYFWESETGASSRSYLHVDQHAATVVPHGNNTYDLLIGCDGGFAISFDKGSNFHEKVDGLSSIQFYSAQRHPSQNRYFGGSQDNAAFISPLNPTTSSSWSYSVRSGDAFGSVWSRTNSNNLMTSGYNGNLYRSTNGGSSFSSINGEFNGSGPFVTTLGSTPQDGNKIVFSAGQKIYVSNNFGASWSSKTVNRTTRINNSSVNKISEANANYIWVGDYFANGVGPFKSTNGGSSFTHVTTIPNAFKDNNYTVSGIATHPNDPNTAYFLFSVSNKPHIIRTTDGGQSWTDLTNNNGFPNVATLSLKVMDHNHNEIWVGTEIGLFISTDNGQSWSYSNSGIPAVEITEITQIGDQVILSTYGRGVYTADIGQDPVTVNAPSNLNISGATTSSLNLSWTDNSNNEDGFKIERATSQNGTYTQIAVVNANSTSYTNSSLSSSTTYYYRIRAYKSTTHSSFSNIANGTTSADPSLNAPSNLQLVSKTSSSVNISWTDNSNNEDGFQIERSSSQNGTYTEVGTVSTNVSSFVNSGLTANTTYYYRVRAYNGSGTSSYSNVLNVTTDQNQQTDYEPNNSFVDAAEIPTETTISSYIQSNGDVDYFKFSINTSNGGALKVTLSNFPGDYDIFLYNSSQSELGRGYTVNDPEIIDHNITGSGLFYVKIEGYNGANSNTDDYELRIEFTENNSQPSWHIVNQVMETPHNYGNNLNTTQSYIQNGAEQVAVYFERLETEANYDYVYIKDETGSTKATYHGTKNNFWAVVSGDEIYVNLVSDAYVTDYGYRITRVAYYSNRTLPKPSVVSGHNIAAIPKFPTSSVVHINNSKGIEIDPNAVKNYSVPSEYKLHSAHPNPFNPSTTITFNLKKAGNVHLTVYNTLGQSVRKLINGQSLEANKHSIVWNGKNDSNAQLPSGIYFIKIQADNFTATERVVLIK